jgi:hypothetical protein
MIASIVDKPIPIAERFIASEACRMFVDVIGLARSIQALVNRSHFMSGKSSSSSINTSTEDLMSRAYRRSTGNGGSRVPLSNVDMSSRGILCATPSL